MRKRKKADEEWKFAAASLLLVIFFTSLVYYRTFSEFKLYIDDADPYSYRAVLPPMFLITLIFFYRKDLKVEKDSKKILLAIPLLAIAALLLWGAGKFPSYGLDALSLPFFVAGSMLLFFNIPTLRKLLFLILYLLLLWAPLFQPLISLQQNLTNFTSDVLSIPLSVLPIQRDGNIFHSGSRVSLEVVPECVPLGAMIALFCFLLPFAYVARGERKNRAAWLLAWVVGGWVLNALRILVVLLLWYYSGVSLALQVFHSVGGNIIFDLALIGSLLSMRLFKIELQL